MLKQNKLTLRVLGEELSGNGIQSIGKCMFTILQNEIVSYTYKIAFVHQLHPNIWLIGQSGWKFSSRPNFDSWQFAA